MNLPVAPVIERLRLYTLGEKKQQFTVCLLIKIKTQLLEYTFIHRLFDY